MVKKVQQDAVRQVVEMHQDMNALDVDTIEKIAPAKEVPTTLELTKKQLAQKEGIPYIEPIRKMQAFGTLPEKLKGEHAHDWEYVKGIYENYIVSGEPLRFWYSKYPGDPDCMWEIPANRPVYVPRMIAKHLEEGQKYHTFGHVELPENRKQVDGFEQEFRPTGTHYRGKFRAIGAFS